MTSALRALVVLALAALVAACAAPAAQQPVAALPPDTDPASFTCCVNPERLPEAFIRVGAALGPMLANTANSAPTRPGHMSTYPAAWDHLLAKVRPLDIFLMSNKNWRSGQLITGYFTQSAVYLGTEAELRALGLWSAPEVVPYQAEIRAGNTMIEAVAGGVHLFPPSKLVDTDAAAVFRPALDIATRRAAAKRFFSHVGDPFDYSFTLSTCRELACTELLARAMPEAGFAVRRVYGMPMVLPDDIAAQAIRGDRLSPIAFSYADPGQAWARGSVQDMMARITQAWGPVPPGAAENLLRRTSVADLSQVCTAEAPRG